MELAFGIAGCLAHSAQSAAEPVFCWPPCRGADSAANASATLPMLLRRRVTPLGQAALRAAWMLPRIQDARFVFASRHGEFDRTVTMLQQVADDDGPSPADFSLGVHNALAGLLSVAAGNRAGHTALAAGVDSFAFGLLEAAASVCERPEQPAMLVYYDAALPTGYPDTTPARAEAAMALALLLVPVAQATRRVSMSAVPIDAGDPDAAAAVFLQFLRTDAPEATAAGEQMRWIWRHA